MRSCRWFQEEAFVGDVPLLRILEGGAPLFGRPDFRQVAEHLAYRHDVAPALPLLRGPSSPTAWSWSSFE